MSSIADARENQRVMMNKYGAFIIPFIIISCLLVTALLFYQNVNIRSREVGLLKALGNSSYSIIFLILFKAFLLGLAGGILGFFIGNWIAEYFGKEIFRFTAMNIKPVWSVFYYTIVLFPLLWMLSSWVPALIATKIDAARTLSKE
jgi:putative ABC transport system permease protein